jgi:murein DD-endopeptidase MepM/ murein hydrolase activator NlpD
VQQGSTIGFVGATGLASGPHLHYEFRVNGAHRDPLTVTMPKPEPLTGTDLATFRAATAPAMAQLKLVEGIRLAAR